MKIVSNTNFGASRQMVVLLLGKIKAQDSIPVLLNLIDDPVITGHVINALGQFKREDFRPYFEKYLNHKNSFYRREARKAISKIDLRTEGRL